MCDAYLRSDTELALELLHACSQLFYSMMREKRGKDIIIYEEKKTTHAHVHAHTHARTHRHTHAHTHTHKHAHTDIPPPPPIRTR